MHNNLFLKKRNQKNSILNWFSIIVSLSLGILFLAVFITILMRAIQGFIEFGFSNIIFTDQFDEINKSFWLPFSVTILTSIISLLISVPLGVKVAVFTKFRISKSIQNKVTILFQTLSGIPSVIFGLFAINSLGVFFNLIFGISSNSIFNAAVMLSFMVLPTIISMTLNSLDGVDQIF